MLVRLISPETEHPPYVYVGSAAAITRGVTFDEFLKWPEEKQKGIVKQCYDSGHWSVFEFVTFDFEVQNVSRVFETQAVRSRLCSFEWESGRHDQQYRPAGIIESDHLANEVDCGIDLYDALVQECGSAPEDARYALPQGVARKGRICRNFRNLMETALNRMCSKTQREYREFMQHVQDAIAERDPFLADFLVPKCKWYGYCNEKDGCGEAPPKAMYLAYTSCITILWNHSRRGAYE